MQHPPHHKEDLNVFQVFADVFGVPHADQRNLDIEDMADNAGTTRGKEQWLGWQMFLEGREE